MENFLFSGVFWGGILILWGASIMLNGIFHIEIPIFRIIIALIFILLGVKILTGGWKWGGKIDGNTIMFSDTKMAYDAKNHKEINILFSRGVIDLSTYSPESGPLSLEIHTIFAGSEININENQPVELTATAAFGGIIMPDGSSTAFGSTVYRTPAWKEGQTCLKVRIDTVFAGTKINILK